MATITTPPATKFPATWRTTLEYLLIGDLLELLEAPDSPENQRWQIALLDKLLSLGDSSGGISHVGSPKSLTAFNAHSEGAWPARAAVFLKLQRLRDRLVHRAPCTLISNEIRCDLRDLLAGS